MFLVTAQGLLEMGKLHFRRRHGRGLHGHRQLLVMLVVVGGVNVVGGASGRSLVERGDDDLVLTVRQVDESDRNVLVRIGNHDRGSDLLGGHRNGRGDNRDLFC